MLVSSTASVGLTTIVQKETPNAYLGRVGSVSSAILMATAPVGQIIFSVLFDKYPTYICLSLSVVILLSTYAVFRNIFTKDDVVVDIG
ncbi:MAG: hypothetical protein LBN09_00215 [Clostridioides sp.]|nr:hypothetical protein [Clostridioides sp.]